MVKDLVTSRFTGKLVETTIAGRVTASMIRTMITDYRRLGAGPVWLIRGEGASSYMAEAMSEASEGLPELFKRGGLVRVVAVIVAPTVRMGLEVVAMSLRAAKSGIDIRVVSNVDEAEAACELGEKKASG